MALAGARALSGLLQLRLADGGGASWQDAAVPDSVARTCKRIGEPHLDGHLPQPTHAAVGHG